MTWPLAVLLLHETVGGGASCWHLWAVCTSREARRCTALLHWQLCTAWHGYHGMEPRVRGSIGVVGKTSARSGKHRHGRENVGTIGKASAWSVKCRHDRGSIGVFGKTSTRSGKHRRVRENVDTIGEASACSGKRRHDLGSIGMVGKMSARWGKHRHGRENVGTIGEASAWSGKCRHDRGSIGFRPITRRRKTDVWTNLENLNTSGFNLSQSIYRRYFSLLHSSVSFGVVTPSLSWTVRFSSSAQKHFTCMQHLLI